MGRKIKAWRVCSYLTFVRKYPETIWLWILLMFPVASIWRGTHLYLMKDIETIQIQKNIQSVSQTFGKWCQSEPCILPISCQLATRWIESVHQRKESVLTSSVGCVGLCSSHPPCNKTSVCMNACISQWDTASTSIYKYMTSSGNYFIWFFHGLVASIFWGGFCIGSFCEYDYYIQRLEEDERLKHV